MALTAEQQAEVDFQTALEESRKNVRSSEEDKRIRLEAVRMAKDCLIENRRTQLASEAQDITAEAITAMATTIASHITG